MYFPCWVLFRNWAHCILPFSTISKIFFSPNVIRIFLWLLRSAIMHISINRSKNRPQYFFFFYRVCRSDRVSGPYGITGGSSLFIALDRNRELINFKSPQEREISEWFHAATSPFPYLYFRWLLRQDVFATFHTLELKSALLKTYNIYIHFFKTIES